MGFLRPYFMANFEAFDGTFRLAQTSYLLKSAPLLHAQSYHPIFHGFANIVHILFCSVQIKKKLLVCQNYIILCLDIWLSSMKFLEKPRSKNL